MNCVHLDFHTSPYIDGIGARFNKKKFTETIRKSKIDLMTVFAKCHHGYTYYPSKVGTMHPGLNFNLLKEEIEAIHDAGAKAPIYITMGWSKKDADEHPEWHHIDFHKRTPVYMGSAPSTDLEKPIGDCSWTTLCPIGPYLDHLEAITHEVCQNFDVSDGIFYDICFSGYACACDACRGGMVKKGLDPDNFEDAKKYYAEGRIEMMKRLTGIVQSYKKDAPVFYNGGANINRTEFHPYQTHYELEDLPTAWGGYDLMPLRAKFFEKYGKHFLGMTGKFHHAWGEFGGFKNKEALRYECADMLSVGASISVGDHLHPSGELDDSTYKMMGHAFDYAKKLEPYALGTKAYTDLAIWISHETDSDVGVSKLLQVMHLEYDTIGSGDSLSKYKAIILPDKVKLCDEDKAAILEFTKGGGVVIASYESIFDELGIVKTEPSQYNLDYIECELDDCSTPFLSYSHAYKVKCDDAEVLAKVYEPYFNRTYGHFCGHKNTPNKTECADYPALIKYGNVLYFAHPVFSAYNKSGNYILEQYIKKGIDSVYDRAVKTTELPSTGRIRIRENSEEKFLSLHVLYAPPINRGNVCLLPDFPKLHDVGVTVKTDKPIKRVWCPVENEKLDFKLENGELSFTLPVFSLHRLVVMEW